MPVIGTFPLRLGDLASWVGSVITGGALVVAFRQLAILRRDRDSRQAALLSMWIPGKTLKGNAGLTALDATIELSFLNGSTQPIGRVLYEVRLGASKLRGSVGPVAPDGVVESRKLAFKDLSVEDANARAEIDLWFTDEAGRRWMRDHRGRLKERVKPPSDWIEMRLTFRIPRRNKGVKDSSGESPSPPS